MGCLIVLLAVITPRILMFFIFLLTDWFALAFHSILWPILGFIFMPYTTLAYMAAMNMNHHQINGGWIVLIIIAVVIDISGHGSLSYRRRF